jgi:hypothetical protein
VEIEIIGWKRLEVAKIFKGTNKAIHRKGRKGREGKSKKIEPQRGTGATKTLATQARRGRTQNL